MSQAERDRERRRTVERYHTLKDAEEDFDVNKAAAESPADRQRLMDEMASFRRRHREEDVARGKRSPGLSIAMHQIMWARWLEIAADNLADAQSAYERIRAGAVDHLIAELRYSLVAITAAACTVEAVYEDVKYLIPERPRAKDAAQQIGDGLAHAFGLRKQVAAECLDGMAWLFQRRNEAVHPYAEPEPPRPHPAGVSTSAEASRFNAPESRKALLVALSVLAYAEEPPHAANRWVRRWATERHPYHENVVAPIRATWGAS
jgi:hypothetical protein